VTLIGVSSDAVEGAEYDIVDKLMEDGTHELVDEMMIEVHYNHPKMQQMFKWCTSPADWCKYKLKDALRIYERLRNASVYAHHWP